MTTTTTLLDVSSDIYEPQKSISQGDFHVEQRRLAGGVQEGIDQVILDNGVIRVAVLPTRGMGIWKAWLPDGPSIGWKSPNVGPVHPRFVPLLEPSGLGWLDGFDELLVRCGLESNGPPVFDEQGRLKHPLHGRIANRPAHHVQVTLDDHELSLTGVVEENRFLFQHLRMTSTITLRRGERSITIRDAIENVGGSTAELQMLYHTNFGAPWLGEGARLVAPAESIVPRDDHAAKDVDRWNVYDAPTPSFVEQVYFFNLHADDTGRTAVMLCNAASDAGISLSFKVGELPCFTQWKNTAALVDGYVTGLEPGTNYPNHRSHEKEQGRIVSLAPGATQLFELGMDIHIDSDGVAAAEKSIQAIADGRAPEIHDRPQPGICAGV